MRQEGDKMIPVDANTTKFVFDMTYRTKPAFMGGMMKKSFKKLIQDYAIAIEHHVTTGENVNKDNFKRIKKAYQSKKTDQSAPLSLKSN